MVNSNSPEEELFYSAKALRDSGNLDEACEIFSQLIEEYPELVAPYIAKGTILFERKLIDEAILCFRQAVKLDPKNETASLLLFHCLWQKEEKFARHAAVNVLRRFFKETRTVPDSFKEIFAEFYEQAYGAERQGGFGQILEFPNKEEGEEQEPCSGDEFKNEEE